MNTGDAVALHHTLEGPEDAPVLVASNSLGTTLRMWDDQAHALLERFRLLRYDHRGHGDSPVPPGPGSGPPRRYSRSRSDSPGTLGIV
jgi:3-oxoadipate enol-lactonase